MDKGFNKINLQNNKDLIETNLKKENMTLSQKQINFKPKTPSTRIKGKKWKIPLFIFLFLLIVSILLFFPARNVYLEAEKTSVVASRVANAIKNQNIEEAKTELTNTKNQLTRTQKAYSFFIFLKFVPVIGNYYQDGDHLLKAAYASVEAGEISVEALIPYQDLLGLKGESTFVSGSADQRIQTAVQTLEKITPKLGEIASKVEEVKKNMELINVNRYPEKIGSQEVRSKLTNIKITVADLSTLFINARPLLENLPSLLGQPKSKKYLILFQNDKELRPTGGFITAYAIFKIDKGKIIVEVSDDIYKLDEIYNPTMSPPKQFLTHLKQYKLYLRDANFEPDYVVSMKKFEEMYSTIPGITQIDGIIALDTHVLVESMKILGPIPAYGTNFTIDNDSRCDCPRVIYDLEEYAGKRVGYVREQRKDIIGVLLYQIMQKALGVSPSQYWGKLFQMMISEFNQKHILVYLHEENSQKSLEALNYAGRIAENISGDYLHINDANLGGAKSNMFVKHFIKIDYTKGQDGSIIKTLTIEYKNPNEGSKGCNLEAGGLCLNGLMPNWVRIYVPSGSELLDFQGSEDPPVTSEAYQYTVFDGFITVKPTSIAKLTVKYKLPNNLKGNQLSLYLQKQPGTEGHDVTISVNGKEIDNFKLIADKKIDIKL